MLFVILIIVFVISICVQCVFDDAFSFGLILLSFIGIVVSLIIIILNYVTMTGFVESNIERYDALNYKVEALTNGMGDKLGINNEEIVSEIQNWNEDLAKGKAMQRDFWVGIYIPNVYDDFERIPYENFKFTVDN